MQFLAVGWTVVPIMVNVVPTGVTIHEVQVLFGGVGILLLLIVGIPIAALAAASIPTSSTSLVVVGAPSLSPVLVVIALVLASIVLLLA